MEADSHAVHADYKRVSTGTATYQVRDGNGANNACAYTNPFAKYDVIQHRIVEEIPVLPDEFGYWVYPS